jgi:translation initiation factor IF-2
VVHAPIKKVELDVEDKLEQLKPRAPVVTIMGHVDHGKTTLLDVIRKSDVAGGEAGGITQHIGAYTITVPRPERQNELAQITFLDTPGHAAFSSMRARGANVTDIVVLVVAANDGVMPQTLEALSHAKAAKVPILVAVNKMDHPNANPMRVRQQLQDKGLVPDDWGGETIFVDVSALTKQGVDKLLEMILLQAELLELKANPDRRAKGNVIESGVEPGGPTATVLVRKGTLRVSDIILCGEFYGRVRALISEEGQRLKEAGPSVAVRVLGLNGVPDAGLEFSVVEDEKAARELAEQRANITKAQDLENRSKVTLENLFASLAAAQSKALKIVVKADTQGSVEAIVEALKKIESDKVTLEILHSDVGTITENDVALASASDAVILGFHARLDSTAAEKAKHEGVQIKLYAIIYELIDQVKEAMAGLLEPDVKESVIGSAEVRQIFELSKGVPVAGCMVANGRIVKGKMRVRRRKDVIYEGIIQSLRRFQDEVNEVRAGMECGIRVEGYSEFQVGDTIECYTTEKVAAKL